MYARQECGIHSMVSNHNNVVKLYDHNETESEFAMYLEYCDKANSLTDKIREVSKSEFSRILTLTFLQILEHIHIKEVNSILVKFQLFPGSTIH